MSSDIGDILSLRSFPELTIIKAMKSNGGFCMAGDNFDNFLGEICFMDI